MGPKKFTPLRELKKLTWSSWPKKLTCPSWPKKFVLVNLAYEISYSIGQNRGKKIDMAD